MRWRIGLAEHTGVHAFVLVWATGRSVRGVVRVLGARASPRGGRVWLWHATGSLPWRSSGGGTPEMVFPLLQWTTGPRI